MLAKQTQEQRKTTSFLKFALGKREIKTDEEIVNEIKNKAYQPSNDPLMSRIAKKYNGNGSAYNTKKGRLMSQDSKTSKTAAKFPAAFRSAKNNIAYRNNIQLRN